MTLQEFVSALWRRRLTIVVSVVVAVAAALAYSKIQTPKYQSTALIQQATTTAVNSTGQSSSSVNLPDPVQELGSTDVQLKAAKTLKDPDLSAVKDAVTGTVDPSTGTLTITATASDPARAQAVAQAYSQAYVDQVQTLVQTQIDKVNGELQSLQNQISALNGKPATPVTQAQIQGLTSSYSALQTEVSNITFGEPYASVQVAAARPSAPSGLSRSKLLAIGGLAGLLVGCGIALGREQFDTRLRASPDIEAITEAPILAELPQDHDVKSGKVSIAMVQTPQSMMAESIRELRTSLRVILHDAPCPVIVVTSPEAGDGKTFVAANLAVAWAMSGSKVVVISADFRRPRLEEVFGLETTGLPGLADLIRSNWKDEDEGSASLAYRHVRRPRDPDEQWSPPGTRVLSDRSAGEPGGGPDQSSVSSLLVESGIWGLQVLPAGTQLENPSELFGSPGMQPVLDQLPLLADVVLLDTPPVLAVPDTAILGSMAHGAVVVASEGRTGRSDLERTVRRLEATHCRVLGVAANRVRRSASDPYQSYAHQQ
ncbi:MAG: Wzz/FepE/Etk N-terminal domain-containing protein [Acidimicrobiales bacterium]